MRLFRKSFQLYLSDVRKDNLYRNKPDGSVHWDVRKVSWSDIWINRRQKNKFCVFCYSTCMSLTCTLFSRLMNGTYLYLLSWSCFERKERIKTHMRNIVYCQKNEVTAFWKFNNFLFSRWFWNFLDKNSVQNKYRIRSWNYWYVLNVTAGENI